MRNFQALKKFKPVSMEEATKILQPNAFTIAFHNASSLKPTQRQYDQLALMSTNLDISSTLVVEERLNGFFVDPTVFSLPGTRN